MKNIVKAVCVIIGAVIGAGFASGREIYIFFGVYGIKGYIGLVIASIVTGITIYKVLNHIKDKKIENYEEYLQTVGIHGRIKEILKCIVNLFLLISFYVMMAGFVAYFEQEFSIMHSIIAPAICLLCYITFMHNIEGITKMNTILIPFLIAMIVLIGIKSNIVEALEIVPKTIKEGNWLIASLEYASYNSILLIPILIGLKQYTYQKEKKIATIVSAFLLLLSTILYGILIMAKENILQVELPLIHIVSKFGKLYPHIYGIVIVSAIYTSAIASGYGFAENSSKSKKSYQMICLILCITAIPISKIGFASLVDLLYPVLGLIGLIQIGYIIFRKWRYTEFMIDIYKLL